MSESIANFEVLIRYGALKGRFEIDDYLDAYRAINPSLHRYCQNPGVFDVEALLYVLARLPDRIHRVREILVQADVPDQLPEMRGIEEVVVPTRRRATFQIGEDRMVVVAREGATELLDLVTLLTAFVVEGYKIHNLLSNSTVLLDIRKFIADSRNPETAPDLATHNRLLVRLAFDLGTTDDHLINLGRYWGQDTLERLLALVDHPPRVVVRLHREYSMQVSMSRSKSWARRIAEQVAERIPGNGPVHIISSNTHSTVNLLSPFPRLHKETILKWAANDPSHSVWFGSKSISSPDLLYYAMKGWMESFPERYREKTENELSYGIFEVTDLDYVGVTAQVIDLARLPEDQMDARLQFDTEKIRQERPLVLNFNYAFGEQAGVVAEELFRQFSHRVASFCIMGKAGTLVGERGGLMLPNYLLREGSRDVYDIPGGNFLTRQTFDGLEVGEVHCDGPMLTVLGTFLQNDELLRAYKDEWRVIGLEMEGIPYLRSLHQCLKLGMLGLDIKVGIGYYASDSPLIPGESLARALAVQGVSSTYALNLAILNGILTKIELPGGAATCLKLKALAKEAAGRLSFLQAQLLLHLTVLVWGLTAILGKLITLPALCLVFYRQVLASLGILMIAGWDQLRVDRSKVAPLMLGGVIIALHWSLFFASVHSNGVAISVICLSAGSLVTSLCEPWMMCKRWDPWDSIGGLLAVIGVVLVVGTTSGQDGLAPVSSTGLLLGLGSAFFGGLFSAHNGRYVPHYSDYQISFWQLVWGSAAIGTVVLFFASSVGGTVEFWLAQLVLPFGFGLLVHHFALDLECQDLENPQPFYDAVGRESRTGLQHADSLSLVS